ncbi:MAG: hypothetical protein LBH06_08800 [Rikenellaceae bacterium]|nr:hypothetical protein [Rikenellaceae bacterium]
MKKDLLGEGPQQPPEPPGPQEELYEVNPDNPYSANNIREAMKEIAAERGIEAIPIVPTHLYVRFLPQDSSQYDMLLDSLHLDLFAYPLDRMLTREEIKTYETDVSESRPYPWQYTKVPPDFVFPSEVRYQFLDSAVVYSFTPDENGPLPDGPMSPDLWAAVLDRAMGIPADSLPATRSATVYWYPQVKLTYHDDLTNKTVPLEGVKVRVSHLLHWDSGWTDANGIARDFGSFRYTGQHNIIWEDKYWALRDGNFGEMKSWIYEGRGPCDCFIDSRNSYWAKDAFFAAVHRACRAVYYDRPFGVTVPPSVTIGCHYDKPKSSSGITFPTVEPWPWPKIRVFRIVDGSTMPNFHVTSTTFHELGHVMHEKAVGTPTFTVSGGKVQESYSNAVEFAFMRYLYPDKIPDWIRKCINENDYTCVGAALQSSGITLKQLESALHNIWSLNYAAWTCWRNNIRALNVIPAPVVDMFFAHPYKDWWKVDFRKLPEGLATTYVNVATTYKVPVDMPSDVTVADWILTDGSGQLSIAQDKQKATLTCTTMGPRAITVRLKLLDGDTVAFTRRIEVTPSAYITGPASLNVGDLGTFTLNNYDAVYQPIDRWIFKEMPNDLNAVQVISRNGNKVSLYPCKGSGNMTLCAQIKNNYGGYGSVAEFPITVPAGASIVPFYACQYYTYPHDIQYVNNTGAFVGYTQLGIDDTRSFYAFSSEPSPVKKYGGLFGTGWAAVLKYAFYNGFAYSTYSNYDRHPKNFQNFGTAFYLSIYSDTHKTPLYLIEEYTVDNKRIVRGISYLTSENKATYRYVTDWDRFAGFLWKTGDKDWTELINYGIMGYAYKPGLTQN